MAERDLNEINVFHSVVKEGSFTRAAAALGLPKSTVSERVSRLEERLGVRLLERTTRSLRLTNAGQAYYERAARIVADIEDADAAATAQAHSPRGLVRVFSPLIVARAFLSAVVAEYLVVNPEVEVELVVGDRGFDLVAERFDLGIHVVGPIDPSSVVRRLGLSTRVYVASPAYLERRGTPLSPQDLDGHDLVTPNLERRPVWQFHGADTIIEREVSCRYAVTSVELAVDAVLHGAGITPAPTLLVGNALRDGHLVQILPAYTAASVPLSLVYPSSRHVALRVRLLLDLVIERFGDVPPWLLTTGRAPS